MEKNVLNVNEPEIKRNRVEGIQIDRTLTEETKHVNGNYADPDEDDDDDEEGEDDLVLGDEDALEGDEVEYEVELDDADPDEDDINEDDLIIDTDDDIDEDEEEDHRFCRGIAHAEVAECVFPDVIDQDAHRV